MEVFNICKYNIFIFKYKLVLWLSFEGILIFRVNFIVLYLYYYVLIFFCISDELNSDYSGDY